MLEALVMGTGETFYDFIKRPFHYENVKVYTCGIAPVYINKIDVYCIGDPIHIGDLPSPVFSPGCIVYRTANLEKLLPCESYPYPDELNDLHGGSSGGMALSLACSQHNHIGLVGFDGLPNDQKFMLGFHKILNHWQSRGKWLYTLMSKSDFNNRLLKPET